VIGIAQLMVVLDLAVMDIALPSAVVTAYTLAVGSLLLLGRKCPS
jgi:hypothetical protein